MRGGGCLSTLTTLMALMMSVQVAHAEAMDPIAPYRSAREAFQTNFRVSGAHDPAVLTQNLRGLRSLAAANSGELRARALLEIAYIERVSNAFAAAASTYTQAADIAGPLGRADIVVDAWIGLARTQNLARDHGAAADALDRAIAAAGPNPTPKQRFEATLYSGELAASRGEIESSLAAAIDALRWAPAPEDRFYAGLDIGSALEGLAETCDYRQLEDSRTQNDPAGDGWGACRRAVVAAETAYARAAHTADGLGWKAMVAQARGKNGDLAIRRQLIEMRARSLPDPHNLSVSADFAQFTPRSGKDVLVHRGDFARTYLAVSLTGPPTNSLLQALLERTIADHVSALGKDDAGTLSLRGDLEKMRTGNSERSTELLARAADLLTTERANFFDPRHRGTVMEGQGGLLANLALRLLAQKRDAAAFAVFESSRARGLGELADVLARSDVSMDDRVWLAQQVKLDAQASAAEQRIVASVVGEGVLDRPSDEISRWEKYGHDRRAHLLRRTDLRDRFAKSSFSPATLTDLQGATRAAGIPVLLFWVTNPNVYAWYIGPHGSDFRIIFLPEAALRERIAQLRTMSDPNGIFNEAAARQLYLYLVAPFEGVLDSKQLIVVPQGELVDLPFEVLLDPESGHFLIENHVVSYAPNATMALRSLTRPVPRIKLITAIVDVAIDDGTGETKGIRSVHGLELRTVDSDNAGLDKLRESLRQAQSVHILMHAAFNAAEPLLSRLGGTLADGQSLVAADLVAIPLRGTKLVVMSACESGELQHRISNEIYGFPWALFAAGAENVVTSRWVVSSASNSQWMHVFYAAVAEGASPAEAAATAMRSMLRADHSKQPYYWAAMQVSGR